MIFAGLLLIATGYLLAVTMIFSLNAPENEKEQNKTTDTWSHSFSNKNEKLSFLTEYLVANSEILNAEYHIVYHDNSNGMIPGPSDWDIRVALKIKPEDMSLWTNGFERITSSEIDLTWWDELATGDISWNDDNIDNIDYYKRENRFSYLVAFPDEGYILKAISIMAYTIKKQ